jgi:hypothetical protein
MGQYAPIGEGVLLVDYDGTLFPWAPLFADVEPLPGAVEAMKKLREAGYKLRIYSSRLSSAWLYTEGESHGRQVAHMVAMLDKYGIPWDGFAYDKEPAQHYIDDRAIEFKNNWPKIAERLVWERGHVHDFSMVTVRFDPDSDGYRFCACGEQER